jgi:gamma-carbonic anhydrase
MEHAVNSRLKQHLLKNPTLGNGVYIAPGAVLIGDVEVGNDSSVWFNATVRGDINHIHIGQSTNIQDNAVIHLADDYPCILGDYVTIGHSAIIHACTIHNECLIGMGAVILDGAEIGEQSLIGAKSLVTGGTKIPPGSLVLGSPAKVVRILDMDERLSLKGWADKYVANAQFYLQNKIQPYQIHS